MKGPKYYFVGGAEDTSIKTSEMEMEMKNDCYYFYNCCKNNNKKNTFQNLFLATASYFQYDCLWYLNIPGILTYFSGCCLSSETVQTEPRLGRCCVD